MALGGLPGRAKNAAVKLAFYEWAYGMLAEGDVDVGILGEFVVGLYIGGLQARRRERQDFDLVTDTGVSVEVKTSAGTLPAPTNRTPVYRWSITCQRARLSGDAPLADWWIFLAATFPKNAGRLFDVFDARNWRVYAVPRDAVRELARNRPNTLGEATLKKAGFHPISLDDLSHLFPRTGDETARLARENTAQANLLLRLAFFRWAYGDLTEGFNAGRFAEFQVMRVLCERPFTRRRAFGAYDLVSRHGHRLEVKYSRSPSPRKDGRPSYFFLVPIRGKEKVRVADHFVFCTLVSPGIDPLPLANWRFQWVPTSALAQNTRSVLSAALESRGYPRLTTDGLSRLEAAE